MAQLKVGDRVSHKRRGCDRVYGIVTALKESEVEPGKTWVHVRWDHGVACLWEAQNLKVEKAKAR